MRRRAKEQDIMFSRKKKQQPEKPEESTRLLYFLGERGAKKKFTTKYIQRETGLWLAG
jgi:hypothetical protein